MINEPFAQGQSIIHKIDPRFRVTAAVFFSFTVALCYEFQSLIASALFAVVGLFLSGIHLKMVLKRLVIVNIFILLFWLILPLTTIGEVFYTAGPINIYLPGIVLAAKITLKSNAILIVLISLVATMTFATLGHTLSRLKIPDKLVFLLMLTYRYIFVIQQEYHKIQKSIKARGFKAKTSLHTYKTFAYIIGMLLIRASDRADRVYNAMRCRGFKGKYYSLTDFQADMKCWIFISVTSTLTICIILMEFFYNV